MCWFLLFEYSCGHKQVARKPFSTCENLAHGGNCIMNRIAITGRYRDCPTCRNETREDRETKIKEVWNPTGSDEEVFDGGIEDFMKRKPVIREKPIVLEKPAVEEKTNAEMSIIKQKLAIENTIAEEKAVLEEEPCEDGDPVEKRGGEDDWDDKKDDEEDDEGDDAEGDVGEEEIVEEKNGEEEEDNEGNNQEEWTFNKDETLLENCK